MLSSILQVDLQLQGQDQNRRFFWCAASVHSNSTLSTSIFRTTNALQARYLITNVATDVLQYIHRQLPELWVWNTLNNRDEPMSWGTLPLIFLTLLMAYGLQKRAEKRAMVIVDPSVPDTGRAYQEGASEWSWLQRLNYSTSQITRLPITRNPYAITRTM